MSEEKKCQETEELTAEQKKLRKRRARREESKKKAGGFWSDFKKFIAKGNIMDLAIAVVIGTAFSAIVNSLVNDIITPLIASIFNAGGFEDLQWVLRPEVLTDGVVTTAAVVVRYGLFIQKIINFLIIAFCIFVAFRYITKAQQKISKMIEDGKKKLEIAMENDLRKKEGRPLLDENGNEIVPGSEEETAAAAATEAALAESAPPEPPAPPAPTQEELLTEIRDLLKATSRAHGDTI